MLLQLFKTFLFFLVCHNMLLAQLEAGKHVPNFSLPSAQGNFYNLDDFKGKYVVLEWVNFGCPFVVKHYASGNMQRLQKKYKEKGVIWLSICSSKAGKQGYLRPEEILAKLKELNAEPYAYLIDEDGKVGRQYFAKTTPHMYIISPNQTLLYSGAIDSIRSSDPADVKRAQNYVDYVLEAELAGKKSDIRSTAPYGCSVKY